ncbi:hypothetical protein BCR33DRAFT_720075 [Rhizoclosmatium globosum]|uniref:Uncharacterized protein n=1 Tax=Rhizoclosmatium globosum TaxID=329046 RepID=A0A1Y2BXZ7_9FUNG|nr:hypothetical protein BCR33DRAFT_720075 [Rhizoclosmatium globosum]|eukprot:ORY39628.1 hypothetical protein BCR33DRAFT_720075 [Rhizoclosmatium globosum]
MATTSKFSKTLHTLLLREIASTSTTPIPELLSYLQSCKQAEITLNPSAYQAVLRYFLKSTPHLEKHTLYEHLCTLATLHPNPPLNIYTPLLTSLTQRIQTLRRAQRLSRTTSDNDTDSTTSTIEALTETSWSLYNSVFTPSTSTSTSQPQLFPTSVLSNLLTIHISSQPRFLTILETLSPHTSQPLTAHIYTLLLRHASRQMKDFTAVQGFYAAYEASTVRDARVVQAMLSSCIWFRRYDVAREVLGRCKGGAGLEGTGWWWRRFGRVVKALEDGEGGDVKVERRVKRLKGRGGVGVWRRVRRRKEGEGEEGSGSGSGDVWDRLITSVGV